MSRQHPPRPSRPSVAGACAAALLLAACKGSPPDGAGRAAPPRADSAGTPAAAALPQAGPADPRWAAVRRVFGQEGEAHDGYFRVNFPRRDVRVTLGGVRLEPGFELTGYFGFVPGPGDTVTGMGEVILLQDEVARALAVATRRGVRVAALHNHLVGETPRILYLHVTAEGPADSVAARLRAVLAATGAPAGGGDEEAHGGAADWSAIDAVLGPHAEAEGSTAEYVFPRREAHAVHGVRVRSTGLLETATEVVFQRLGGSRVACGGELYVRPGEVQGAVSALEAAGLHVSALHNHSLEESPPMLWIHWFGTGEGTALARGVAAALAGTGSARRSAAETS